MPGLADKRTVKKFLAPLRRIKWVVYCKEPFAGPQQVLRYLSRYTHRVAISTTSPRRASCSPCRPAPNSPIHPRPRQPMKHACCRVRAPAAADAGP
jgi:hypothetical protein